MMDWNGDWGGWSWLSMTLFMVICLLALGVIIWLVVRRMSASTTATSPSQATTAEGVLRQRYAAGEIDDLEFQRRLRTLRGQSPLSPKAGADH
jgi:putative membrane protein